MGCSRLTTYIGLRGSHKQDNLDMWMFVRSDTDEMKIRID